MQENAMMQHTWLPSNHIKRFSSLLQQPFVFYDLLMKLTGYMKAAFLKLSVDLNSY